jgi:phosphoribosylformylglycinamidine cyclo-ligase
MRPTLYRDAGVDIASADEAKKRIAGMVRATHGPEVLGGIGGFGGLFALRGLPADPVLVSSTDGVGTKLVIAFLLDRHHTVGADIVNHCVNDILVQGARPLFFLDDLATGRLRPEVVEQVVRGIAGACRDAGCALIGGETAEMPGFYQAGEYDLAGTIVGLVSEGKLLTGSAIREGDAILGLASSGLHTNGYSLARRVLLEDGGLSLGSIVSPLARPLGDELLAVHRCYAPAVLPLVEKGLVHGMVHITGGGFQGNIPRVLPEGVAAEIAAAWEVPPVFRLIAAMGNVPAPEMFRTFNMGIGLLLFVPAGRAEEAAAALAKAGEKVIRAGRAVGRGNGRPPVVFTGNPELVEDPEPVEGSKGGK